MIEQITCADILSETLFPIDISHISTPRHSINFSICKYANICVSKQNRYSCFQSLKKSTKKKRSLFGFGSFSYRVLSKIFAKYTSLREMLTLKCVQNSIIVTSTSISNPFIKWITMCVCDQQLKGFVYVMPVMCLW